MEKNHLYILKYLTICDLVNCYLNHFVSWNCKTLGKLYNFRRKMQEKSLKGSTSLWNVHFVPCYINFFFKEGKFLLWGCPVSFFQQICKITFMSCIFRGVCWYSGYHIVKWTCFYSGQISNYLPDIFCSSLCQFQLFFWSL